MHQLASGEVPELHPSVIRAHQDFVEIGVGVGHAGGDEARAEVYGLRLALEVVQAPDEQAAVGAEAQKPVAQRKHREHVACVTAECGDAMRPADRKGTGLLSIRVGTHWVGNKSQKVGPAAVHD